MNLDTEVNGVGGTKMGREDEIRLMAYSIWEQEGCCDGRDVEHWLRAEVIWEGKQKQEQEIASTQSEKDAGQATVRAKKKRVAKKKS